MVITRLLEIMPLAIDLQHLLQKSFYGIEVKWPTPHQVMSTKRVGLDFLMETAVSVTIKADPKEVERTELLCEEHVQYWEI